MQIGAMTNPYRELLPQIHWIGEQRFDYVDLAVEPPMADLQAVDAGAVREALRRHHLDIVVHTSPYLPLTSRHTAARTSAWSELGHTLALAGSLGSALVTLHYLGAPAFYSTRQTVDTYVELLAMLVSAARGTGMAVALENSPINRNEPQLFREIFRQVPDARLLLDVGHTHINAGVDSTGAFLNDPVIGERLVHVHLSDNNGAADLHLPPGSVRNGIDWPETIRMVRHHPYDGRLTLEVFSPDADYLLMSRDKVRRWWQAAVCG